MTSWQLQAAKSKLSELVKKAASEGPQAITVHGEPAVVVLSQAEYNRLTRGDKRESFIEFMRRSPLVGLDLEFERDKSKVLRKITFEE